MKVTLTFVPPGGGEQDYMLDFELPALPREGDYISVRRKGAVKRSDGKEEFGTEDFIVRRIWWHLETPEDRWVVEAGKERIGSYGSIVVECEFAIGGFSSESHKAAVQMYENRGKQPRKFEMSGY